MALLPERLWQDLARSVNASSKLRTTCCARHSDTCRLGIDVDASGRHSAKHVPHLRFGHRGPSNSRMVVQDSGIRTPAGPGVNASTARLSGLRTATHAEKDMLEPMLGQQPQLRDWYGQRLTVSLQAHPHAGLTWYDRSSYTGAEGPATRSAIKRCICTAVTNTWVQITWDSTWARQ